MDGSCLKRTIATRARRAWEQPHTQGAHQSGGRRMTSTVTTTRKKSGQTTFDFTGQVVIVTGASGGIGSALADKFAQAGADLVLHGRKAEALEAKAAQIRELGRKAV